MMVVNRYGASGLRGEDVLGSVETFLIGKPGTDAFADQNLAFRDLALLPLVLPSRPNGLRATLDQLSRKQGIELQIVMEVDTGTAMKDVAMSGCAYTLLPLMAVREEVSAGSLAVARIVRPGIERTIAISLTTSRPLSNASRFVAGRLRQLATEVLKT